MGFPGGSDGKESACNARDPCSIPGSGSPLEKGVAAHSSILAWRIPWTEEPGGLQSMGSQRVGDDGAIDCFTHTLDTTASDPLELSVQFSRSLCLTLFDPMDCSMLDLAVHHKLPEFTQTHVH